jgi:chemotaxis protein MotB
MSRRRRPKPHVNHERWLVSYADFITLMFAFFVVMFASSQADKKKAARVASSIQGAFQELGVFTGDPKANARPSLPAPSDVPPATKPNPQLTEISTRERLMRGFGVDVDSLKRELEEALGDEIEKREVEMRVTPEGLVVSLQEVGFFRSGEAGLLPGGLNTLARIANVLGDRGFEIRVEGHTDNVPIHNPRFKSNWELSTARATEVVSLLIEHHGFNPLLISAAGYSEYRPLAENTSVQGRARNRRVDLVVVGRPSGPDSSTTAAEQSSHPEEAGLKAQK